MSKTMSASFYLFIYYYYYYLIKKIQAIGGTFPCNYDF